MRGLVVFIGLHQIALQTYEKIPDDELVGNKGRPVIQACADHLLGTQPPFFMYRQSI